MKRVGIGDSDWSMTFSFVLYQNWPMTFLHFFLLQGWECTCFFYPKVPEEETRSYM